MGLLGAAVVAVILAGAGVVMNAQAPAPEAVGVAVPRAAPASIAVIGDFGSDDRAEADVARIVRQMAPSSVVTTGDNLYSSNTYAQAVGSYYCRWIAQAPDTSECPRSAMARVNSFFPATGNHDYSDGGIENYLAYFGSLRGQTTFAVTRGGVEFIVVDSQAALDSPDSMAAQRSWAEDRAGRSTADWQVVVLHHPPYSSSSNHGSTPEFQWPFASWGVDLVLSGHDHDYERIRRDGITYVVVGSGGADLYSFGDPVPGSAFRNDRVHGALLLTPGSGGLQGAYWSTAGRRLDTFTIPSG